MDEKLKVIQNLLDEISELNDLSPSTCARSADAHQISDDIIHKLLLIRRILSCSPPISPDVMTTYALLNADRRSSSSPSSSRKSSSTSLSKYLITHTILNNEESSDPRVVARSAYDSDNYAKCIRIIEKLLAQNNNQIDREMINLCHDSYKKIVANALTVEERYKFCKWWRIFLESIRTSDSSRIERLQLIDCKTQCLLESQKMVENENADQLYHYTEQLMKLKIDAYELTASAYRPCHIECLRRIQKICALIVAHFERFPETEQMPLCIDEGLELCRYALDEAKVDADAYARETGATFEDLSYLESTELIKEIELILYENGYSDLTAHSDRDSCESISSEEGQQNDNNVGKCHEQLRCKQQDNSCGSNIHKHNNNDINNSDNNGTHKVSNHDNNEHNRINNFKYKHQISVHGSPLRKHIVEQTAAITNTDDSSITHL